MIHREKERDVEKKFVDVRKPSVNIAKRPKR
jgi:hypothetical protein